MNEEFENYDTSQKNFINSVPAPGFGPLPEYPASWWIWQMCSSDSKLRPVTYQ